MEELPEDELRALQAIAAGLTVEEAADVLGWSPVTIKKRLERARRLLAAKNTAHAIALAFRAELLH